MTDNEIVKALECCLLDNKQHEERCSECPMYETPLTVCQHLVAYYALDLINRQKAEIEMLEEFLRHDCNMILSINHELLSVKEKVINEFAEKLLALKIKPEFPWDDFYVTEDAIHSIKKEMMEKLEENNNER